MSEAVTWLARASASLFDDAGAVEVAAPKRGHARMQQLKMEYDDNDYIVR